MDSGCVTEIGYCKKLFELYNKLLITIYIIFIFNNILNKNVSSSADIETKIKKKTSLFYLERIFFLKISIEFRI